MEREMKKKDPIKEFENHGKIEEHLYDTFGELRCVPPGHVYVEEEPGVVSIRPMGVSKRFFEVSGGGGEEKVGGKTETRGVNTEDEPKVEAEKEETVPQDVDSLDDGGWPTAARFELDGDKEVAEEESKEPGKERVYQRSVREIMKLIKAAETLEGLEALKEPDEDRKTVIRALLNKRKEILTKQRGNKL